MLYALSAATSIIDIVEFCLEDAVSMDSDHGCFFFEFCLIICTEHRDYSPPFNYSSRCICLLRLYRPIYPSTYNWQMLIINTLVNSSNFSQDISLLDYMGLQHLCCDRSFILSICILRFINLSSFTCLIFDLWFLAIWIVAGSAPLFVVQGQLYTPDWGGNLEVAGLTLSMTVNALVTGLIVFRIFKVFQEAKACTADDQILVGVTGGSTLRRVIFILIESGMALFSIQLARLVVAIVNTDAASDANSLLVAIHEMLNVICKISHFYVILLMEWALL